MRSCLWPCGEAIRRHRKGLLLSKQWIGSRCHLGWRQVIPLVSDTEIDESSQKCGVLQGMSIEAIAEMRHLKVDTVESYLAEAITAGRAYDWHHMRISDSVYTTVSQHASAQLKAAGEPKEADEFTGISADSFQQQDRGLRQETVLQQSMASRDEEVGTEGFRQQETVYQQSQSLSSDGDWEV